MNINEYQMCQMFLNQMLPITGDQSIKAPILQYCFNSTTLGGF